LWKGSDMRRLLLVAGILAILISIVWWVEEPGYDALSAFITGIVAFIGSFFVPKQEKVGETLDQRNRRVMLNHVENFWVKGVLDKSLHGAALLELGIKEDPTAVSYPWTIKKEATSEILPAGKSMLEIFEEIGMGRSLLILGAPGSGKTTMLLELARQLIERARKEKTEPIPVVFNLASWKGQVLADWLAEQLNTVYYVPNKTASSWVDGNRMFILLDGLDEVKQDNRSKCVKIINQFRLDHGLTSLVICSRIEEYSAIETKLFLEGAIILQPLTSQQIDAYFERFGNNLVSIRMLLKKDWALQEFAETPLILSIMTLAYKDRKADELVESVDSKEQHRRLFNAYVTRMFERLNRHTKSNFSKEQTLHYLSWLARKMIDQDIINYRIDNMQPSWLDTNLQRKLYKILIGLIVGIMVALIYWPITNNLLFCLMSGLLFGFFASALEGYKKITMVDKFTWSWKRAGLGLGAGMLFGFLSWLTTSLIYLNKALRLLDEDPKYFLLRLITFLGAGTLSGLFFGVISIELKEGTGPDQPIKQTFANAFKFVVLSGLIFGVFYAVFLRLNLTLFLAPVKVNPIIFGLVVGFFGALVGGLIHPYFMLLRWPEKLRKTIFFSFLLSFIDGIDAGLISIIQHYSLRALLILTDVSPKHLIQFLDYAVDLIFLRRVGGSYIFVHRLLMEHFAQMEDTPQPDR
jgi:hypothetical protein